MTAVTALKAKEQGGPAIKLQIMMWPIVDAHFDTRILQTIRCAAVPDHVVDAVDV
jgi:hypothetical protein